MQAEGGKAGGRTGILSESLLHGGPELHERPLLLKQNVWRRVKVVKDWQDVVQKREGA